MRDLVLARLVEGERVGERIGGSGEGVGWSMSRRVSFCELRESCSFSLSTDPSVF